MTKRVRDLEDGSSRPRGHGAPDNGHLAALWLCLSLSWSPQNRGRKRTIEFLADFPDKHKGQDQLLVLPYTPTLCNPVSRHMLSVLLLLPGLNHFFNLEISYKHHCFPQTFPEPSNGLLHMPPLPMCCHCRPSIMI